MVDALKEGPRKGGHEEESEVGVVECSGCAAVLEGRLEGPVLRQVERQQGEQWKKDPEKVAQCLDVGMACNQ